MKFSEYPYVSLLTISDHDQRILEGFFFLLLPYRAYTQYTYCLSFLDKNIKHWIEHHNQTTKFNPNSYKAFQDLLILTIIFFYFRQYFILNRLCTKLYYLFMCTDHVILLILNFPFKIGHFELGNVSINTVDSKAEVFNYSGTRN